MSAALSFQILIERGRARRGLVRTAHGTFETPAFMPVGTAASVKGLDPRELAEAGAEVVLANTYHLALRPGAETVGDLGGLHAFMAWPRSILTDSGGFQVMSLSGRRRITEDGVVFRSHLDGSPLSLTPESVVALQDRLGTDIAMPLDVCPHHDEGDEGAWRAVNLSAAWARRAAETVRRPSLALFGIIQGGDVAAARRASIDATLPLSFDGHAIGGVQVGEAKDVSYRVVEDVAGGLPADRPRYVMGVGTPADLVTMAALGIDMFDTVLPTRNARNGQAFTSLGRVAIKNARYARDEAPLDPACGCPTCRRFSRAYLRHLYQAGEILAATLLTRHNVQFYLDLMRKVRDAIAADSVDELRAAACGPTADAGDGGVAG